VPTRRGMRAVRVEGRRATGDVTVLDHEGPALRTLPLTVSSGGHPYPPSRVTRRASTTCGVVALLVVGVGCAPSPRDADTPAAPMPATSEETDAVVPSVLEDVRFTLDTVVELDAPIDVAARADGSLLVAQRAGLVVLVPTDGGPVRTLLDMRERTTTDSERGLLSIALSEDEALLVVSSTDLDGSTLIEALPVDGRDLDLARRRTLWSLPQPRASHNGGAVRFGPDGMLYLGLGDGGGRGDPLDAGQDLTTPLGALLRLDVAGDGPARIPADNPFVGVAGAAGEIVASGLRNPWRFSFDPATGDLWLGDVGQGEREEINRVPLAELPGTNFGWNRLEGTLPFSGRAPETHTPPVHEYAHGPGCSVTGGIVYRGRRVPELVGAHLFSDLCDGTIRALVPDGAGWREVDLGVTGRQVVGFAPDADGEVLIIDLDGRISRLRPA